MNWSRRGVLVGLTTTAGCAVVGPDYTEPDAGLGARFLTGGTENIGDVSADPWWTAFRDKRLTGYVEQGLAANLSVKAALARIEQAEARVRQTGPAAQVSGGLSAAARCAA